VKTCERLERHAAVAIRHLAVGCAAGANGVHQLHSYIAGFFHVTVHSDEQAQRHKLWNFHPLHLSNAYTGQGQQDGNDGGGLGKALHTRKNLRQHQKTMLARRLTAKKTAEKAGPAKTASPGSTFNDALEDEVDFQTHLARRLKNGRQAIAVGKGHGCTRLHWGRKSSRVV